MFVILLATVIAAVTELTESNYATLVTSYLRSPFMIFVHSPTCGGCTAFQPHWNKFTDMKVNQLQSVGFGTLNCNEYSKLCRMVAPGGTPQLIWSDGVNPSRKVSTYYSEEQLTKQFQRLVTEPVTILDTESDLRLDHEFTFVLKYNSLAEPIASSFWSAAASCTSRASFVSIRSEKPTTLSIYYWNQQISSTTTADANIRKIVDQTLRDIFPLFDASLSHTRNRLILMLLPKNTNMSVYSNLALVIPKVAPSAHSYDANLLKIESSVLPALVDMRGGSVTGVYTGSMNPAAVSQWLRERPSSSNWRFYAICPVILIPFLLRMRCSRRRTSDHLLSDVEWTDSSSQDNTI